jgi:hypothetical protein
MTLIPNDYQKGINEAFELSRKERDALKAEIKELNEQLRLHSVSNSVATKYAEFCVRCDRDKLPLLCLEDYIKQYCN